MKQDEIKKTTTLTESDVEQAKPFNVATQLSSSSNRETAPIRGSSRSSLNVLGLWVILLSASFILPAALIPAVFLKGISDAAFAVFIFFEGVIGCSAALASKFLWHILSQRKVSAPLKFVVVLWIPALLSQVLYLIPGSLVRVSNNDHSLVDFAFYILTYLILPSLTGSSFALLGVKLESFLLNESRKDID